MDHVTAATTDARGRAVVDVALWVPYGTRQRYVGDFFAFAKGYAERDYNGHEVLTRALDKQRERVAKHVVDFTVWLHKGTSVRGRVMLDAETPAAHCPILVYGDIFKGDGTWRFGLEPRVFTTDAEGRFVVPGRNPNRPYRLALVLDAAARAKIAASWARTRSEQSGRGTVAGAASARSEAVPAIAAQAILAVGLARKDEDLGTIRVDQMPRLALELERPDARPARGVRLLWCETKMPSPGPSMEMQSYPIEAYCDRRGRCTLLAPSLDGLALFAGDKGGFVSHMVSAPAVDGRRVAHKDVSLQLDAGLVVRGKVEDGSGRPLSKARVSLVSLRNHRANASLVEQASRFCLTHALEMTKARTAADGSFELVLPMRGVRLDLSVRHKRKRRRIEVLFTKDSGSADFHLDFSAGR